MSYRVHPITRLLSLFGKDINELDNDPKIQLRIHTIGFWYWTINFPIIVYLFFYQQHLWIQYGLFITLIYSNYSNWTSDYTGMSASQMIINTTKPINIETTGSVNVLQEHGQ